MNKIIRHSNLTLLLLFMAVAAYSQDTLFFDENHKRVALLENASTFEIHIPDTARYGNIAEIAYWKSGKIKSYKSFNLQFNEKADSTIIESFTSGRVAWNDTSLEKSIDRIIDGTSKEWYENGQLRKQVEYKKSKRDGFYISYWENGQIKRKEQFIDDKSIEGKCFNIEGKEVLHTPLDKMPEFPGGNEKLPSFLSERLHYPKTMLQNGIRGMVMIQFTVNQDGSLSDIKIKRGICPEANWEAIRVVSLMPKWNPGICEDEPVSVIYFMPIRFELSY